MAEIKIRLLETLFPRRCPFCGSMLPHGKMYCGDCEYSLPRVRPPVCMGCARAKALCVCRQEGFLFSGCAAPFYYEGEVKRAFQQYKFARRRHFAPIFAENISDAVRGNFKEAYFDLCCAVPLSRKSLSQRGYDQSVLLARETAKKLSISFQSRALVKTRETKMQHLLPLEERLKNPKGVYTASAKTVKDKTVLLVDDVMTTGATLTACAQALLEAGAKQVFCAVLAVAVKIDN